MTTAAKTSFGAVLKLAVSPGTPATVAELTSITPPAFSREVIDVTTHDSADDAMEFIADGVWDPGEIQVQGNYVAGNGTDDLLAAAAASGAKHDFEILVKASSGTETMSGSCYLTNYAPDGLEVKGKQGFSATLKVSGPVSQVASS